MQLTSFTDIRTSDLRSSAEFDYWLGEEAIEQGPIFSTTRTLKSCECPKA